MVSRNTLKRIARLDRKAKRLTGKNLRGAVKTGQISNAEWGMAIGILLVLDIIQAILDIFIIGELVNRIVDIVVGFLLWFYLQIRGQSFRNMKRLVAFASTVFAEFIPVVDALPFWSLDGIYNMSLDKAEQAAEKVAPKTTAVANNVVDIRNRQIPIRRESGEDEEEEKMAA